MTECKQCGVTIRARTKQPRKYCSTKCSSEYWKNNNKSGYQRKTPLEKTCVVCSCTFSSSSSNAKFCSNQCRTVVYPEKEKFSVTCLRCGMVFLTAMTTKKYCSANCSGITSITNTRNRAREKRQERLEAAKGVFQYRPDLAYRRYDNELDIQKESEFAEWFKTHYWLFGFTELVLLQTRFPDALVRDKHGRLLRVELEYKASNYTHHSHPGTADLIISYIGGDGPISGIPVISLFKNDVATPSSFTRKLAGVASEFVHDLIGDVTHYQKIGCSAELALVTTG